MTGATSTIRGKRDTGAARLPGLPAVSTGNAQLDAWITAATERLEVREGQRGNGFERAVTVRELQELEAKVTEHQSAAQAALVQGGAAIAISVGGMKATLPLKTFEDALRASGLYQDMKKRLDDPRRFDDLRAEVREELLRSITELARKQGAKIERVERIVKDANLRVAMRIETVTAAAADATAGARELMFASAEQGRAQAGHITQLEASIATTSSGLAATNAALGQTNDALDQTNAALGQTNDALDQTNANLAATNTALDQTNASLGQQVTKTAKLEQQMSVTADKVEGLSAQYTLKVQAGGALAGFGLSATEKDGEPDSAFIIAADKFAIVNPTYSAGLTNTPDSASIPFGVDASGIYLNNNVYVKGQMRVDTGGKTLADGLRGSMEINTGAAETAAWSDTAARNAVWTKLGKSGTPSNNNHLVIGDMVMIGKTTKQWMGSSWAAPGVVINGDMLVNGTIAGSKIAANTITADKIDTRGLTIKDENGNVIFGAGTGLDFSRINGLGELATLSAVPANLVTGLGTLATQSSVTANQVSGLGSLATQDGVTANQVSGLGSLATQNGVTASQVSGLGSLATQSSVAANQVTGLGALATQDKVVLDEDISKGHVQLRIGGQLYDVGATAFVHALNKIKATTISHYMESAAIGSAYIGNAAIHEAHIANAAITNAKIQNAAVDTLQIAGNAVTVPTYASRVGAGELTYFGRLNGWKSYYLLQHTHRQSADGYVLCIIVARNLQKTSVWEHAHEGSVVNEPVELIVGIDGRDVISGKEIVTQQTGVFVGEGFYIFSFLAAANTAYNITVYTHFKNMGAGSMAHILCLGIQR